MKEKSEGKIPSQKEMLRKVIPLLKKEGERYKKEQTVLGRKAKKGEKIVTVTSDGSETKNTAKSGDFIVKNNTKAGERYIIPSKTFNKTYLHHKKRKGIYDVYKPNKEILAIEMNTAVLKKIGFQKESYFVAPWGSEMIVKENDFLVCPMDYSEVYRIARKEFFETYKLSK